MLGYRTVCIRSALDLVSQTPSEDGDVTHEAPCLAESILPINGLEERTASCHKKSDLREATCPYFFSKLFYFRR